MKEIKVNKNQVQVLVSVLTTGSAKDIAEMRKLNRVLTVIEKLDLTDETKEEYELSLEDADFETLKTKFNSFEGWNLAAQKLVLEVDTIMNKQNGN